MINVKFECIICKKSHNCIEDAKACSEDHGSKPIYEAECTIFNSDGDVKGPGTFRMYMDGTVEVTEKCQEAVGV
jgi:hypothetical protein